MLLTTWTEDQLVCLTVGIVTLPMMGFAFMLLAIIIDDNDDEGGFQ